MKVKFLGKKLIGYNTYSLILRSKKRADYLPGQYIYLTLPGILPVEGRGPTRQFTLSSSPTETDLVITTKENEKSAFKRKFMDLVPDTEVEADGPMGTFYFDQNSHGNHVFIAGGMGITPFRSMLKFAVDRKLTITAQLYYFVSNKEDAIFTEELAKWQKKGLLNYEIIETQGKGAQKINAKKFLNSHFWITGPASFVTKMENMLLRQKVERDSIHFEKFTGLR